MQGYDANALYAYCVAQQQPVDHPVCSEYKKRGLNRLDNGLNKQMECRVGVEQVGNFDTGSGMALEEINDTGSAPGCVRVMTRYN